MKLLAIDTATEACSAALWIDGEVQEERVLAPRGHAERILPMVERLLGAAGLSLGQLDALAVDRGPGSFTGVRIGISVTQGLAFAADLPVHPVSSLAALAQGAWHAAGATRVLSLIDARMDEIYWGSYVLQDQVMTLSDAEQVSPAELVLPASGVPWLAVGTGYRQYRERLPAELRHAGHPDSELDLPRASHIAELAAGQADQHPAVPAEQLEPVYLRNDVVQR